MPASDLKIISQGQWIKGIVAVSNRFSIPKGALPFIVNLLMAERGALQVCDGSARISGISAPPGAWLTIGSFTDFSLVTTKIGVMQYSGNQIVLYNLNTDPATPIANAGTPTPLLNTANWLNPQIFEFAGSLILTVGNDAPPQIITAIGTAPANLGSTAAWLPDHLYFFGDVITNTAGTHQFICYGENNGLTISGGVAVGAGIGPLGLPAGLSGSTEPAAFDAPPDTGGGVADGVLLWQRIDYSSEIGRAANQSPRGAAHMIQHLGALWAFNTSPTNSTDGLDGPCNLRQSAIQNPNSWPEINIDYVGRDDGTTGTGMAVFTIAEAGIAPSATLILFKDFSAYEVSGLFQTPSFTIQQIKSDMGCIAPRTPLFATGYGIFRLSHLGVAQYNGVSDELISEEVRPYLFGGFGIAGMDVTNQQNCRAALCVNPPMYIMAIPLPAGTQNYYGIAGGDGSLIRVLCYDLVFKAWAVIDLPFKILSLQQLRITGQRPLTVAGGFNDGVVRQLQAGDATFDNPAEPGLPTPIAWSMETPIIGDATKRNYFRRVNLRMHAPTPPPITIQPIFDADQPPTLSQLAVAAEPSQSGTFGANIETVATYEGEDDLVLTKSLDQSASSARAYISGEGKATIEAVDWTTRPKPPRPAGVLI